MLYQTEGIKMAGFLILYIVCMVPVSLTMLYCREKPSVIVGICLATFIPALALFAIVFPEVLIGG